MYYNNYDFHPLLLVIKSQVLTLEMHKDLQNRDASKESRDCITSPWILSRFSKVLCTSAWVGKLQKSDLSFVYAT